MGELPLNEPDFFAGWLARQEAARPKPWTA